MVLHRAVEYSYTSILGAWYSAGEQNTVTQVYWGRGTPQGSRIQLHRFTNSFIKFKSHLIQGQVRQFLDHAAKEVISIIIIIINIIIVIISNIV